MIFLHFVEAAVALGLVLMIGTQVVYPLVRGTPIFPVFRTRKMRKAQATARDLLDAQDARRELNRLRKEAEDEGI